MIILTSDNCQPCNILKRLYHNDERVEFLELQTEQAQAILAGRTVRGVPALLLDDEVIQGAPAIDKKLKQLERQSAKR